MLVFSIIMGTVHMNELKKINHRNVEKRHKDMFVSWFEREVSRLPLICLTILSC